MDIPHPYSTLHCIINENYEMTKTDRMQFDVVIHLLLQSYSLLITQPFGIFPGRESFLSSLFFQELTSL